MRSRAERRRQRGLGLALLAVGVAAAAGCSSSDSPSGEGASHAGPKGARPADACTMLTSDEVSSAIGTPGPYTGAHEDPGEDGKPVWGCTWGTQDSYADTRETTESQYTFVKTSSDLTVTSLSGLGDGGKAILAKGKNGSGQSYVLFEAAGRYYESQVTVDRRELDASNTPREASAAQELSNTLAKRLAG